MGIKILSPLHLGAAHCACLRIPSERSVQGANRSPRLGKKKLTVSLLTSLPAFHATAKSSRRPFYDPCTHTHTHAIRTDKHAPYFLSQNY